ncbi:HAD-IA family hydrolase [Thiolinea disciformis]|uniref:HAD-IA family hydrolase n=1 Tax=Thiolinea disciformis TaxID=125614 RepID=UPI0003759910|nr:HAD-IA family hydrolase [Thiolinea disciformis]
MKTKPYALVIFDWDGTLIDSQAHIIDCIERASLAAGVEPAKPEAIRHIIGLGLLEAMQTLYPSLSTQQQQRVADEYRAEFMLRNHKPLPLFDGARLTLEYLAANGYELAIATGKSRAGLNKVLQEMDLKQLFPVTRCADETLSKPHPLMLQEILQAYDRKPAEALMIGDTTYDLEMARAIQMDALGVSCGAHDVERLLACQPRACLNSVQDLPAWLEQQDSD